MYDLLDTRTIIETGAAHDVAKNAPRHPEILKKMQKSIEISLQMRADPSMADTSEPLRKLEHEFHMLYVELTENQMLISLYQNIWNKNVLFYLYNLIQYPISLRRNGFDSHREIYEAILRGDSDKLPKPLSIIWTVRAKSSTNCLYKGSIRHPNLTLSMRNERELMRILLVGQPHFQEEINVCFRNRITPSTLSSLLPTMKPRCSEYAMKSQLSPLSTPGFIEPTSWKP